MSESQLTSSPPHSKSPKNEESFDPGDDWYAQVDSVTGVKPGFWKHALGTEPTDLESVLAP